MIMRPQFLPSHGLQKLLRPMVGQVSVGHGGCEMPWHRCPRLFSTSAVASEDPKSIKGTPKRLSKQERKILVESFVNNYKTLNAGKFPTVSAAQKEVGGSYYVIRQILQEMKHTILHKSAVGMTGNSSAGNRGAEDKATLEQEISPAEEAACSHSQADREIERHLFEVEKAPHAEEKVHTTDMQSLTDEIETEVEKRVDAEVGRESTGVEMVYGQPLSSMPCTGEPAFVDKKDAKSGQGFIKPNISTSNLTDHQESLSYDGLRETSSENSNNNDPKENPSIWTNLKSFAGSIFSIWRKR